MDSEDNIHDHLEITSKCDHDVLLENEQDFKPIYLPISLLEAITKNFSDGLCIGDGGSAVVYKGLLKSGGTVAVKKLKAIICMDDDHFHKEVSCLMKVKHKNIVRFLGYCADTQGKMEDYNGELVLAEERQRLLCFEYLPNGSLEKYISDVSGGLEWSKRYKIIRGICEGLQYLHENNIVHLDLKPANILLSDNMVPKISDFGLSRCFEEKQSRTVTSTLVGSLGYLAPEFFNGEITRKLDIYSLGVIIAEMLTGKQGHSPIENVLESWRKQFGESPDTDRLLEQVRVCTKIRMGCGNLDPAKRPDIRQITAILNVLSEPLESDGFSEVDCEEVFKSLVTMQHTEGREMTRSLWWNSHISPQNSNWLVDNIEEVEMGIKVMIKYLEADADSFARRVEMYYKTQPLLMPHVEKFYRQHRSLANRYHDLTDNMHTEISETNPLEYMRHVLSLSYNDLSHELKTRLLYGMYSEDYEIPKENLVRKWIAEGFVREKHCLDVEEAAENCFSELINRNMIQPVFHEDGSGEVPKCQVHNLMLDLILSKCKKENFFTIIDKNQMNGASQVRRIRHLSLSLPGRVAFINGLSMFSNLCSLSCFDIGTTIELVDLSELTNLRYLEIVRYSSSEDGVENNPKKTAQFWIFPSNQIGLRKLTVWCMLY